MNIIIGFILIQFIFQIHEAKKYPTKFPSCFRDDPNLSACMINATEILKPKLDDSRELGLPSLNPYIIPLAFFEQGTEAVNFKISLANFSIYGLNNFTFSTFSVNPKTLHIRAVSSFGSLHAFGNCIFEGRLFVIPLQGKGTVIIDTAPPTFTIDIDSQLVQRNGVEYIEVINASVRVDNFGGKARFENFQGANAFIVTAVNKVIDENSDELLNEVSPIVINFLEDLFIMIFGQFFKRYPYEEILPLSPKLK